ncbi:YoaK family protein [Phyllobacterium sp. YR531]|uniref:YoaK family protein n=1 Tax=Phyllobacterium sp. YR531 TaxID=1144343 RepID=UPI00026FC44F|nr:YoaK family protein [Phyllobacterium sp. YR531]EJM97852.1 putative membrane protein [Phyllobacterium sp. YR531]
MLSLSRVQSNSLGLAFISGFADALFFAHLGGLFVGLVTGNVVLIGLGLVGHEKGGLRDLQLLTFPFFMVGAGLAAIMVAWVKPLERATFWTLISSAAAFAISALLATFGVGPVSVYTLLVVIAMGMLTAIERLDPRLGPPFSLMTGNIAGLAVAVVRRLIGYTETRDEWRQSLTSIILVFGFVAGCAAGAFAYVTVGVTGMILPACLLLLIGIFYSPQSA